MLNTLDDMEDIDTAQNQILQSAIQQEWFIVLFHVYTTSLERGK